MIQVHLEMAIETMRMCRVWLDELLSVFSDVHANELFYGRLM